MFYISLFIFVFFVTLSTMAEVKKELGEFKTLHKDSLGKNADLTRSYSSRSMFRGLFGFNWCSHLDVKLTIEGKRGKYFDCESSRFATEDLIYKEPFYIVKKATYTFYFSNDGKLSHWQENTKSNTLKNVVYVIYKDGRIDQILVPQRAPLKVLYNTEGLIRKIGEHWEYEYQQGLLNLVRKNKKQIWRYQYDEFLNMTLWRGPSGMEEMKYDNEWDRIVYVKDHHNCRSDFQYEIKSGRRWIAETKKCLDSKNSHQSIFELVSPNKIIQSDKLVQKQTDTLDKKFRQGASNESTF